MVEFILKIRAEEKCLLIRSASLRSASPLRKVVNIAEARPWPETSITSSAKRLWATDDERSVGWFRPHVQATIGWPPELTYTVTTLPSQGTLYLSGWGALALNDTFTQAELNAGNLTYDKLVLFQYLTDMSCACSKH